MVYIIRSICSFVDLEKVISTEDFDRAVFCCNIIYILNVLILKYIIYEDKLRIANQYDHALTPKKRNVRKFINDA